MAKPRKVPDFSPEQLEQIGSVQRKVLDSYSKPADEPAPAPKPLLPNFYRRGGRVDVNPKNPFAAGGPQLPRK